MLVPSSQKFGTTAATAVERGWRGKWGGIVILGRAPVTAGFPAYVEGLEGRRPYGGVLGRLYFSFGVFDRFIVNLNFAETLGGRARTSL